MKELDCYSLWLVSEPEVKASGILQKLLVDIATVYGTPAFKPHVTLLGSIQGSRCDLIDHTKNLASQLHPLKVKLGTVGTGGNYFKTLFLEVKKTGSLLRANALAKETFRVVKQGKYLPHCSLVYGDLNETQIAYLRQQLLQLQHLTSNGSFLAKRIELWRAKGKVENWYLVETFPLGEK